MINLYETPEGSRSNRCVQKIFEDIPGGAVLVKSELRYGASGLMSEGALLHVDSDGLAHLCKTCKLWSAVSSSASGCLVYKNHQFKPGDNVTTTELSVPARSIQSIDTSATSYDVFDIGSGFGIDLPEGSILIQAAASGENPVFKYSPDAVGISELPVNLQFQNTGFGLLVRGSVKENLLPYYVDETIKNLLPLIRFV